MTDRYREYFDKLDRALAPCSATTKAFSELQEGKFVAPSDDPVTGRVVYSRVTLPEDLKAAFPFNASISNPDIIVATTKGGRTILQVSYPSVGEKDPLNLFGDISTERSLVMQDLNVNIPAEKVTLYDGKLEMNLPQGNFT